MEKLARGAFLLREFVGGILIAQVSGERSAALLRQQIETEEWHVEVTLGRNSVTPEKERFKALFTQKGS